MKQIINQQREMSWQM